ncbi:hypothetical protein D9756_002096 [Leucocoprinus leucothites]|uniref:Methyltransferase domain-containing protein n=1 Tax=Leucocoprinus leucothites TaxID=201217 RepID=A0A8H5GBV6_9AGAR|nr:hypothetical protein D9756_002096 [Leucoagaricus leucothites]
MALTRAISQRLDLQHLIWTKLIGGLYPSDLSIMIEQRLNLNKGAAILDVGCGTGIWALGMCKRFPQASVIGLDITNWNRGNMALPRNYSFTQCDLSKDLPSEFSGRFDIIQCRAVLQHMAEPKKLVENMAQCLKPGGILLLADGELSQGSFHRSGERIQPFIYDASITAEQNIKNGDQNPELSWLAGDIWMDVSLSENGTYRGKDQDVKELISVNYVKAFDAVRSVLVRQGIPDSFVKDVWEPRILHELKTREFTSLWHYISTVRIAD